MITEAQRRALFALREALHLCEGADITVSPCSDSYVQVATWTLGNLDSEICSDSEDLLASDIDRLLAEHPDA